MTVAEKKEYWLKFHRFQQRYEKMYVPKINAALKDQIQQYILNKDTVYVRSGGLYEVLLDLYLTTGPAWAYQTRGMLKKSGGQMGFSDRIVAIMRQMFSFDLLADAENITQTTIRIIGEVLSDAALEGWSFDEIVKRLVSPDLTASRARLIARTETVGAANAGSLANANATGLELNKIWIAARDNRTRDHHREVDNIVIPKDDLFKVGESEMMYPGDKRGSAAEVCNCRCAIAFIPVDNTMKNFKEDVINEQRKSIEPLFDDIQDSIDGIKNDYRQEVMKQAGINDINIKEFNKTLDGIKNLKIEAPIPIVNLPAPIVNLPAPIVNVEAPIVKVTENIINQDEVIKSVKDSSTELVELSKEILTGQNKIIDLLTESLKPKPKQKWEFTNVFEKDRIVRSTAKEL